MNKHNSFFSLAEIKQPVNQWICVAFLGIWCFWIVLYYSINRAVDTSATYTAATSSLMNF